MGRTQDFTKSVIYHIRHTENKEVVYVGSTTNFPQRKSKHKYRCNDKEGREFKYPIYCHIRDNGGYDCFEVIPIKLLKLENKTELLIAEQEEIDKHHALVNRKKAYMTIEERKESDKKWREEHKTERSQYNKLYYQEHKEERNQNGKQYYQENKEKKRQPVKCPICNSNISIQHLKRHQRTKKCQEHLNK